MTLRNVTDIFLASLTPLYGSREALSIAYMVVEHLYGTTRVDMALDPMLEADPKVDYLALLEELVSARPVQYVLGVAEFCGLEFAVREGVLIPREETAELVGWVVSDLSSVAAEPSLRVLDVGTGSGCIACSVAHALQRADVWAVDISAEALQIAAQNSARLGVNVHFVQADVLEGVDVWGTELCDLKFDVVVSNPPYVPERDREQMHCNVKEFEPCEALFVPDDNILLFYKAIATHGATLLKKGGLLYFEIYERAAQDVCRMLTRMGYTEVTLRRDINGRERMVRCRKKE